MIKKFLNAFLVGALSLCVLGTVSSCTDYDDDISALSDRIDDLESSTSVSISSLTSQISSINSTISSLDSDLQSQIDAVVASLSGYATTSDLSALQSALESELTDLESALKLYADSGDEDVLSTVNTLLLNYYTKTELDNIFVTAVAAIDPTVSDLQSAVNAIVAAISDASTANATLEAALDALEADMADKLAGKADYIDMVTTQNAIVAAQEAIEALQEDVAAINVNLQDYASAKEMQTTINTITTIQETLETLQESLDALEADMADKLNGKADYIDMVTTQNAIVAIQESLETINSLLEGAEENIQDQIDAINEAVTELGNRIAAIEDESWFGDSFAKYVQAYGLVDTTFVETAISTLSGEINTSISELTDLVESIDADLTSAYDLIDGLDVVITQINWQIEEIVTDVDILSSTVSSLQDATSGYYDDLSAKIGEWTVEDYGTITDAIWLNADNITYLSTLYASLQNQIEDIYAYIEALADRVQSIVYAPEYTDGKILFTGAQYVTDDNSEPLYLRAATDASYATATFYVSPASVAEDLLDENTWTLSIVSYVAKTRAEEEGGIEISNKQLGAEDGTIVLTLKSTYAHTADQALMIALHAVKKGSTITYVGDEGTSTSTSNYGTDYTTSFIQTGASDGGDVTENFVLAIAAEDGTYTEVGKTDEVYTIEGKLPYTSTDAYNFFDGTYEIAYNNNGTIISLADAATANEWTVEFTADSQSSEPTDILLKGTSDEYASTIVDQTDSTSTNTSYAFLGTDYNDLSGFQLADWSTSRIGEQITGAYGFTLTSGEQTLTLAANDVCTIADSPIEITADEAISFTWNFSNAYNNWAYPYGSSEVATLTFTDDNEYASFVAAISNSVTCKVYDSEGAESDITAEVSFTDKGDNVVEAQVNLKGDLKETASYKLVADISTSSASIKANIDINVTGAPHVDLDLGDITIAYDPSKAVQNYSLTAANTKYLSDNTDLTDSDIIAMVKKELGDNLAQLSVTDGSAVLNRLLAYDGNYSEALSTVYSSEAQYIYKGTDSNRQFVRIDPTVAELDEAFTLTTNYTNSTLDFDWNFLTVTGTVTVTCEEANAYLTIGDALNTATNTVTIEPKITYVSSQNYTLSYENNDLSLAAYYNGTDENYSVEYVVTTEDCDASVTGSILSWGTNYGEKSLDVTAYLYYGSYLCDQLSFTCVLNDPLTGSLIFNGDNSALPVYASTSEAKTVNIFSYNSGVLLDGLYCTCEDYVDEAVFGYGYPANPRYIFSTSLGAELTYGEAEFTYEPALDSSDRQQVTNRIHWDEASTTLTVDKGQLELAVKVTVTIPVKFTYRFGEYTTNIVFEVTQEE